MSRDGSMRSGPILVAVDDQPQTRAAVRFAGRLAAALKRPLMLASVQETEYWRELEGPPSVSPPARVHGEGVLADAVRLLGGPNVGTRLVAASSAAHGLHTLAQELGATLLVLGRSHQTGIARRLGGTAERLLHGAPCPVAVVPDALEISSGPVLVGYDETAEADAAVDIGVMLAGSLGTDLELCHVGARTASPEHRDRDRAWIENMHAVGQRILDHGASRVPSELASVTTIVEGHAGTELARRAVACSATCVIVGSREYGPVHAVLLGSVTRELLDRASTPVLVIPRPRQGAANPNTAGKTSAWR
jgi:nucleotide-binding universal stress UspA family protein